MVSVASILWRLVLGGVAVSLVAYYKIDIATARLAAEATGVGVAAALVASAFET